MPKKRTLYDRFWEKVDIREEEECWLWTGGKTGSYGMLCGKGAHVISYTLSVGEVPPGHCVRHSCNIKLCVNPKHLSVGTQKDNLLDQIAAGNRKAFLTPEQITEIKILRDSGLPVATVAAMFDNISTSYVYKIADGFTQATVSKSAGRPTIPLMIRFFSKVNKGSDEECWPWLGSTGRGGHGIFIGQNAHRWYYKQVVGPVPDDMVLSHQCDIPACVNPKHLLITTNVGNIKEMWSRGRAAYQRPEYSGVRDIVLALYMSGTTTPKDIALSLGIDRTKAKSLIQNLRKGGHLPPRSTPDSGEVPVSK